MGRTRQKFRRVGGIEMPRSMRRILTFLAALPLAAALAPAAPAQAPAPGKEGLKAR